MKQVDYSFCDYMNDLWNLYQVRGMMSSANAARRILDTREEIYLAWLADESVQDYFMNDEE